MKLKPLIHFQKNVGVKLKKQTSAKKVIIDKGVLRVGRRGSGNYFHVYRRPNGKDIRFKLELTKSVVKNFEFYLFSNQFEKLEELLCIHFYKRALTTFVMGSCYIDWLKESFSQVELEKKLLVKEFLNQFCVSNKDLTKIKKQLIDSVSRLKDSGLIENEFSLTFKNVSLNETKKIEDLSPRLLSNSESLSFWEKMQLKIIRF